MQAIRRIAIILAVGLAAPLTTGAEAEIENVRFDDLHRGGIVLPDRAVIQKWKDVSFGDGCLSEDPEQLGREYNGKVFRGQPAEPLKPKPEYISR